ncbi:dihydroorotate dehydrogenase (NAD+) catalytic subunit [Bacilli bacterium PM5-3]|nr:dihydroorotate dehydrogenase (NAD+) catalytic subunit [Bacilli bacterium PM5-3]MDH6604219.1 dihydroorotate dehydrogenase (NAD+) catalytic subunit [Bacilli bacterium PM5-9]
MNTKINIPGLELDNPIIPASGTFGFGYEFANYYDINILGSISLKGTTLEARYGNPLPRIAECKEGLINAIGLQNPGIDKVLSEEIPKLEKVYHKKVIANVAGSTFEDYVECAKRFDKCDNVGILEINVSCPNVKEGGISFGVDEKMLYELALEIKKNVKKPVYIKLSPNVSDIVSLAKACQKAGVDGLVMINTLLGMRIDLNTRKPVIANKMGGFSGPAIKPVALRMIYQVAKEVDLPIIGCGGISNAYDVIEMMLAGASAIQIGSENLIDPYACKKIIEDLPNVMKELNIENLNDIIGGALNE